MMLKLVIVLTALIWVIPSAAMAQANAGELKMWAGPLDTIPTGWLPCDGSQLLRANFPELFAVIGTNFGSGDGATTFNLPDFRDRSPMGASQDESGIPKTGVDGALTQSGGEAYHQLTIAEMPSHTHQPLGFNGDGTGMFPGGGYCAAWRNGPIFSPTFNDAMAETTSTGNSVPHNNLHPYFAVHFIIAARSNNSVPTIGSLGLIVMTIAILAAGSVVMSKRAALSK